MTTGSTRRRPSIALRLALGLSAGMALLWIGAAAISVGVMQHELNEAYDDSLQQSAMRLLPLALHDLREPGDGRRRFIVSETESDGDDDHDDAPITKADDAGARDRHSPTFTYLVRDPQGGLVLRDENAPAVLTDLPSTEGFGAYNGHRTFLYTEPRSSFSILLVETTDRRLTALRDSIMAIGLPLLALLPLIAGGVWLAMRLALRPLEALRKDIAQRDSRNLSPLGSDGHPVELAPIAEAVGALLERLKSALDAERSFAARSAHELRTPIAGALAQTQQLAAEIAGGPGAARIAEIETALKKLSKLSEKLLQLARIEAGFARSDAPADQLPVLGMVIHDVNAMTQWRNRVQLTTQPGASLTVPMDPDAFAIALRNLVENALKHGTANTPIEVLVSKGAVRIRNQSPAIAPDDLARLGQPFMRGDTRSDGSGLGLSIARTILEQAGGRLTLSSPIPGEADGFEALVELP